MTNPKRLFRNLLLTATLLLPLSAQALNPGAQYVTTYVGEETSISINASESFYYSISNQEVIETTYTLQNILGDWKATIYITGIKEGDSGIYIYNNNQSVGLWQVKVNPAAIADFQLVPVYCFHSPINGYYFTVSAEEKAIIIEHPEWTYTYLDIAYYAYVKRED